MARTKSSNTAATSSAGTIEGKARPLLPDAIRARPLPIPVAQHEQFRYWVSEPRITKPRAHADADVWFPTRLEDDVDAPHNAEAVFSRRALSHRESCAAITKAKVPPFPQSSRCARAVVVEAAAELEAAKGPLVVRRRDTIFRREVGRAARDEVVSMVAVEISQVFQDQLDSIL